MERVSAELFGLGRVCIVGIEKANRLVRAARNETCTVFVPIKAQHGACVLLDLADQTTFIRPQIHNLHIISSFHGISEISYQISDTLYDIWPIGANFEDAFYTLRFVHVDDFSI